MLIIGDTWTSFATCTSANDSPGFSGSGVTNGSRLLDINPKNVYQSPVAGPGFAVFTSPARLVDTFALLFTGSSSSGTWRARGAASVSETTSNPLIDSGTISIWPETGLEAEPHVHAIYRHPTPASIAAIRLDVNDVSAPPDSILRIGRFMADLAYEPTINFSHQAGYGTGYIDHSIITTMMDGSLSIERREMRAMAQYVPSYLPPADREEFLRLNRFYGSHHPVVVVEDIDVSVGLHRGIIHGLIEWSAVPVQSDTGVNRFRVPVGIQEMGQ